MANQSTSYFEVIPILSHDLHEKYAISVSVNTLLFCLLSASKNIFVFILRKYIAFFGLTGAKIHFLLPVFAEL